MASSEKWPMRSDVYCVNVNKLIDFDGQISDGYLCSKQHNFLICEQILNIAKSEQSSHTPGSSHQRPYFFNWKERKMEK